MSWIQTYTGRKFDLSDPQPEMVTIEDIAHALSNVCRYTGHCKEFYSVAQHSVYVSEHVAEPIRLQALLHDATEAYVTDVSRPLKQMLPAYREIEDRVWRAIAARFGLPEELAPEVKGADNLLLMTERDSLMAVKPEPWTAELEAIKPLPMHIRGWDPHFAEARFTRAFNRLRHANVALSR